MKTLEQAYGEILGDDAKKKAFAAALKEGSVESFLRGLGCGATAAEVMDFLEKTRRTELTMDDLDKVAAGWCTSFTCATNCGCTNT